MANSRFQVPLSAVAGLVLLLAGCAQTTLVDSWRTDEPVNHKPEMVGVSAALPDAQMRQAVEIDIASVLHEKGINTVAGRNLPGLK